MNKKVLLKEDDFISLEKLKKIKENGYEIIPRKEIEGIINHSLYKFMVESYCKRCGKIYIKDIYDYEINNEIEEQDEKNSKFKIKIGKYSSQKYQIEKYHCKKCCKDFENEYENFLENKTIFKLKKIGIMGNGVSFLINDIDFLVCFGLGYLITFKNGKKFEVYSIDIIEEFINKKYSTIFKVYSADGRKEILSSFYGSLLEEKDENTLQILISKLEKIGFEQGDDLEYSCGYPVFRHKDFIIKNKDYKDKECFYKVNAYEAI